MSTDNEEDRPARRRQQPPAQMHPAPGQRHEELRHFVDLARLDPDGVTCPTCGSYVKVNERSLTVLQCRELYRLWRVGVGVPVHYSDWVLTGPRGGQNYYMHRYYGFITQPTGDPSISYDRSGIWCLTDHGREFVENLIEVPQFAYVVNRHVEWWSNERWSYSEASNRGRNPWRPPSDGAYADLSTAELAVYDELTPAVPRVRTSQPQA